MRTGGKAVQLCVTLSLQSDSGGAGIQKKKEENLYSFSRVVPTFVVGKERNNRPCG